MKKYIIAAAAMLSAATFTACDDMLDTDPRPTEGTPENFTDVDALNAGTYSIMNVLAGRDATSFPLFMWEIMSDNCYGSGGLQDDEVKSLHHLVEKSVDQYQTPFITLFGGVKRANTQIETIAKIDWTGKEAKRNQLLGEAYFMRGLYYLWLTEMYGDLPLLTATVTTEEMETQVSAEDAIFPQIISDFVSAKTLLSKGNEIGADGKFTNKGSGHANRDVAKAFIARAYMFWAGFYKKAGELATNAPAIELVAQEGCEGGSYSKDQVAKDLEDIISSGRYTLCPDYRSLWQYSNSLLYNEAHDGADGGNAEGTHAYAFIADMDPANCFDQPGMGNGNQEELFAIQFMNASKWAIGDSYYTNSRQYSCYVSCFWGLRCNGTNGSRATTYPFNQGWGQGTPSVNIWDDWTAYEKTNAVNTVAYTGVVGDIRKLGSLIDCVGELDAYTFEKDDCEESGYSVKKFNSVSLDACAKDLDTWWTKAPGYVKSSLDNSMQGDHFENFYLMRYADVLLMHTELTGNPSGMNQVQQRAGVQQTAYSLDAVQKERRWEFAFEGIRWNDMRRWTGKGTKGGYASKMLQAQEGKAITVKGNRSYGALKHMTCSWTERYEATDGFLSKPQAQINLMNGKLTQNEGWDAADSKTQYKQLY